MSAGIIDKATHQCLVSVVMPVHNSGKYLNNSVTSVLKQNYTNIEVICVDDGSSDNSLEILNLLASQDARLRIIKNPVQGAGGSRNMGLRAAKGDWVLFLDSDDTFSPDLIGLLVRTGAKNSSDIVICEYYRCPEGSTNRIKSKIRLNKFVPNNTIEASGMSCFLRLTPEPWNKLFKTSFLISNDILFQNTKHANDLYATTKAVLSASNISYVPECLINYRVGNSASTQGKKDRFPTECLKPIDALLQSFPSGWSNKAVTLLAAMHIRANLETLKTEGARQTLWRAVRSDDALLNAVNKYISEMPLLDKAVMRCLKRYEYEEFRSKARLLRSAFAAVPLGSVRNRALSCACVLLK